MLQPELPGDGAQLRLRLLETRAGMEAADSSQRADVTTVESLCGLKRQPDFRTEREPHTLGHHAHDRRRLAVDAHDAADDFGVRPMAIA